MNKAEAKNFRSCLKPMPDILVSCRNNKGEVNALAVGYAGNCSYDPPMVMVGIVPSRYSYHMIKETGEFVVNLVPESLREKYAYLGSTSRRDEDKLVKAGMNYKEGVKVKAPILLDCPVNIECKVVDSIMTGSHEMFIGKVEYIHADEDLLDDNGNIDYSKIDLLKFR
ncbi:flavin reductase family protein [Caldisalinibacter kiritimatiensis]|uniref:Flavoredoxin n=1 Tax=Caldisalinibacter kiritimatiensis TaxID=1304284 RepID=R1CMU8_9FIRM|nr:flavin reductase family protein [Caldisalinibacter kiritimatiensis]EOD00006.1 Flavoredoxin [Caldisalinibacter kiritimatiensis]